MGYRIINGVPYPVGNFPAANDKSSGKKGNSDNSSSVSFKDVLKEEISKKNGFTVSKHAAERMKNINFDAADMNKINDAINKAKDKGAKNCLIVYKDAALVTSVENRTVITAVEGSRAKDNVYTNIDSVILL